MPVKKGPAIAEPFKVKQKQGHDEQKKEKMMVQENKTTNNEVHTSLSKRTVTQKQNVRKLIPIKFAKARKSNTNLDLTLTSV